MTELTGVESVDTLRQLFRDYPELCSRRAHELASEGLAQAVGDEDRHIFQSRLTLLERAAAGDYEGAYAGYQEAAFEFSRDYFTPRISRLFTALDRHQLQQNWPAASCSTRRRP